MGFLQQERRVSETAEEMEAHLPEVREWLCVSDMHDSDELDWLFLDASNNFESESMTSTVPQNGSH